MLRNFPRVNKPISDLLKSLPLSLKSSSSRTLRSRAIRSAYVGRNGTRRRHVDEPGTFSLNNVCFPVSSPVCLLSWRSFTFSDTRKSRSNVSTSRETVNAIHNQCTCSESRLHFLQSIQFFVNTRWTQIVMHCRDCCFFYKQEIFFKIISFLHRSIFFISIWFTRISVSNIGKFYPEQRMHTLITYYL